MEFIDTHNHILPGVDDGAPDLEASLEMARIAREDGITTIVATPHVVEGIYEGRDLDKRVESLQQELDRNGIGVRLLRGAEVPISTCMTGDRALLADLAIGGRYILMESAETGFEQLVLAIYQVRLCGLSPVLAHPERTTYARDHLERLAEMIDHDDVYCQLTIASLSGLFGQSARKTSIAMARRGLAHLLASDAHSAGRRSPQLSWGYQELARLAGEEAAMIAVNVNPRLLTEGKKLRLVEPASGKHTPGYLRRLLRRG
ncbi:MAG: exopolysaccharide biosynthesis protein [Gaiellales bacterium]|nr:MAG: exopolysaccharide biosynthesis protein [Gaiellales bacterium]